MLTNRSVESSRVRKGSAESSISCSADGAAGRGCVMIDDDGGACASSLVSPATCLLSTLRTLRNSCSTVQLLRSTAYDSLVRGNKTFQGPLLFSTSAARQTLYVLVLRSTRARILPRELILGPPILKRKQHTTFAAHSASSSTWESFPGTRTPISSMATTGSCQSWRHSFGG